MCYPDNCIRGISSFDQHMIDDDTVAPALFYFEMEQPRNGGWTEGSINWHDDDGAIGLTLNQRKPDGRIQFRVGAAILPRDEIDHLIQRSRYSGQLSYDRCPQDDNRYHGNLLLQIGVGQRKMKVLAAALTVGVARIIHRSEE